jgi:vitamin B12 transporter
MMNNSNHWARAITTVALAYGASIFTPALADTALTTPELLVTTGATPMPTKEVASSFTIITAEDIEAHQYRTLPDALKSVPGLTVVQSGGAGTITKVFMRGMSSNQTLVLLNGQPINDPSSPDNAFNFAYGTLDNVKRIEVVRGAQSALYGSQAMAGVINIITKTGKDTGGTTMHLEAGTLGTLNVGGTTGGQIGKASHYFASLSRQATDGNDLTPSRLRFGTGEEKDGNENVSFSGQFSTALNAYLDASAFLQYTDAVTDLDEGGTDASFTQIYENYANSSRTRQLFASGDIAGRFMDGRWRPKLSVGYTQYKTNTTDHPDSVMIFNDENVNNNGTHFGVQFDNGFDLTATNTLSVGTSYTHDEMIENGFRDLGLGYIQYPDSQASTSAYSVSASDHQTIGENFFVTVSGRYDMPAEFDDHFSYTVAPGFYLPETNTRLTGSYGTAFKVPSLYQRFGYSPYVSSFGSGTYIGNPSLEAEKSKSWDVGIEQGFFADRLKAGATWFNNQIENGIVVVYPTFNTSTSVNVTSYKTHGLESFIDVQPFENVHARVTYTFTIVDATTPEPKLRRPKHQVDFTTDWSITDNTTLGAEVLWVGAYLDVLRDGVFPNLYGEQGGYAVTNISVTHKINNWLSINGKVNNLFDRNYEPANGFQTAGIEALAGVTTRF